MILISVDGIEAKVSTKEFDNAFTEQPKGEKSFITYDRKMTINLNQNK